MSDVSHQEFVEIADRCFVARYAEWDVSVGVVLGSSGLAVIDTRASARQGRQLHNDVRRFAPGCPLRWVINTHEHFDHTFGNVSMTGATIYAHENVSAGLKGSADRVKRLIETDRELDPDHPEITGQVLDDVLATGLRAPDVVFASVATIDLGDRLIELMHPGRGHTDGDVVARVPDADVVFGGDLVEQSGPPSFGPDSFPLDWPTSLDLVVGLLTDGSVVVPGHGATVDRQFVQAQRADVSDVSQLIRSLYQQGVALDDALAAGGDGWPYPAAHLATAVRRGYTHLASQHEGSRQTLPLVER
ncbi:MAG: MBL fold metallo-hydrolase [Propionibacteriales bacterium]|nr:MBL fold metallo-hydrolase [Propionibacteriales bacterium]